MPVIIISICVPRAVMQVFNFECYSETCSYVTVRQHCVHFAQIMGQSILRGQLLSSFVIAYIDIVKPPVFSPHLVTVTINVS